MTNSQSCIAVTIVYGPPTTLTEHGGLRWHKTGMSPLAGYLYKPWDCVIQQQLINQDIMLLAFLNVATTRG